MAASGIALYNERFQNFLIVIDYLADSGAECLVFVFSVYPTRDEQADADAQKNCATHIAMRICGAARNAWLTEPLP